MEFNKIKERLLKGEELEEILKSYDWKFFEDFVAEIFLANGFKVKKRFVFKTNKKFEIDVFAEKDEIVFCVECKKWKRGRYKKYALKKAAKKLEEKCKELQIFLKNKEIFPLIVTLYQEDVLKHNSTFFVPVWKLNNFLLNLEIYFK